MWAAPALSVAAAAPAVAASPFANCTAANQTYIKNAFETIRTKSLTAYWATPGVISDGIAQTTYFNVNNNSQFDLTYTATQNLNITFTAIAGNGSTTAPNGPSSASASRGTVSGITSTTYNGKNAKTWTWNAAGFTQPRNAPGSDSEFDMGVATGSNLSTGGIIICATLNEAPILYPTFASLQAANPAITADCQAYYDAMVTQARPAVLTFAGPLLSGSGATWNRDGNINTLCGGSMAWTVGSTICSNTSGNYNSVPYPPGCGTGAGYNGIF